MTFPFCLEAGTVLIGCVPLGWSGSGSVIQDHSDHGRSNKPMNPCPVWIHRFIWSTMIRVISDHRSWSGSSQRNAPIVHCFRLFMQPCHGYFLEQLFVHSFKDRCTLFFLVGLRVQTTYLKRKYTVWGVSRESADRLQFDVDDETSGRRTKTTVAAYFKDRYRMQLRYASLHLTSCFSSRDLKKTVFSVVSCYWNWINLCLISHRFRFTGLTMPMCTSEKINL